MTATRHQHCAACGATLAPDQRYCVQCGQRRGPARMPFARQPGGSAGVPSPPPSPRRPRMSPNAALIAGIGTLMLAMGTGVLIGRSATSNARSQAPYQVITVPSAGAATGAGSTAGASELEAASTEAQSSGESSGGAGKSKPSKSKAAATGSGSAPKPKKAVVTVGSKGKGPGYEKGHFTGKFFGGGSSESEEEEEE